MSSSDNKDYSLWIALVFLLLAVTFIFDIWGDRREIRINEPVAEEYFTAKPIRNAALAPVLWQDDYGMSCNECHADIDPSDDPDAWEMGHEDIVLNHGINSSCRNCHHRDNKEALAGFDGKEIPFPEVQELCHKCHAMIFRDWDSGAHGRIKDYWNEDLGPKSKLKCVECHNPHHPKFPSMEPSPSPVTEPYMNKDGSSKDSVKEHDHE